MPRTIIRIVTILLIPCLIADPALAAASATSAVTMPQGSLRCVNLLNEQAINESLVNFSGDMPNKAKVRAYEAGAGLARNVSSRKASLYRLAESLGARIDRIPSAWLVSAFVGAAVFVWLFPVGSPVVNFSILLLPSMAIFGRSSAWYQRYVEWWAQPLLATTLGTRTAVILLLVRNQRVDPTAPLPHLVAHGVQAGAISLAMTVLIVAGFHWIQGVKLRQQRDLRSAVFFCSLGAFLAGFVALMPGVPSAHVLVWCGAAVFPIVLGSFLSGWSKHRQNRASENLGLSRRHLLTDGATLLGTVLASFVAGAGSFAYALDPKIRYLAARRSVMNIIFSAKPYDRKRIAERLARLRPGDPQPELSMDSFITTEDLRVAREEPVHRVPITLAETVREIREDTPRNLAAAIVKSARRHNIPPEIIGAYPYQGDDQTRAALAIQTLGGLLVRRGHRRTGKWLEGLPIPPLIHGPKEEEGAHWAKFIGGTLGGKTTTGVFQLRSSQVREYGLFSDLEKPLDASLMSDREISWLLLDPVISAEAYAAFLEACAREVDELRRQGVEYEKALQSGHMNESEKIRLAFQARLSAFNRIADVLERYPLSEDPHYYACLPALETMGSNYWRLGLQHPAYRTKIMYRLGNFGRYVFLISGITDQRPAIFTEVEEPKDLETLRKLLSSRDPFLRAAAVRTLKYILSQPGPLRDKARGLLGMSQNGKIGFGQIEATGIALFIAGLSSREPLSRRRFIFPLTASSRRRTRGVHLNRSS